ncbi:DUF2513 domain-containing protein [Listeria aquatica]|uniref:DUF2513 domain-containing protein n=1 Tax=Listeria aquatica TaxID=1494960 RepID=UPI003EF4B4EF
MKLNADCMRQILFTLEDKPLHQSLQAEDFMSSERTKQFLYDDIVYSVQMLEQKGFIAAKIYPTKDRTIVLVNDLTIHGQEFLEEIYSDTKWNKIKSVLKEEGLPTSINRISKVIAKLTLN